MILYIVQAHRDIPQIVALVRQISTGRNFCVVNLDPRMLPEKAEIERQLAALGRDRICVRAGAPPNWGGISQVHALLDAMAFALTVDDRWEFLVNLSADSIALAPQSEICSFYAAARRKRQRIHIAYFGTKTIVNEFHMIPRGSANFELELKPVHLYRRVSALVSPEIEGLFQSRSSSPLFRWKSRGSIHVADLFPERKLVVRPLLPTEAESRRAAFANRPLWGGRAWFTLERSAVERILTDPLLARVTQDLEHFFCPDELFLHTYLGCTTRFKPEEINRSNQRFRNGDAAKIDDRMLGELISSGSFFARKVRFENCPLIARHFKATE